VITAVLTNPKPCGGTFFTSLFPKANPAYVAVIKKMFCNTSLDAIGKALAQEPFVVKMINFVSTAGPFDGFGFSSCSGHYARLE
jgi:hypothetical protein